MTTISQSEDPFLTRTRSETGASLLEYSLVIVLLAVVALAALPDLALSAGSPLCGVGGQLADSGAILRLKNLEGEFCCARPPMGFGQGWECVQ